MGNEQGMGDQTRAFLEQHVSEELLEWLRRTGYAIAGSRGGEADVTGLVQKVVLLAGRAREQLQDPARFRAWIRTILVREVLAELQLERHRRRQRFQDGELEQVRDDRDEGSSLEQEEEQSLAKAQLADLLAQLSEADREVICLSRLKGLPDEEVADLLGITQTALRQRRKRALDRLQQVVEQPEE
jgi:RNA polymerase sigma-70 factor (ECF subfamily)